MPTFVGKIGKNQSLNATQYFDGPWKEFLRQELEPNTSLRLTAAAVEYAVFVMNGAGQYQFDGRLQPLSPGSAVTVGHGAEILITAGDDPLELFITSLTVAEV